ncbi:2-hydroxy-3-oxopropionate reductase [Lichenicola sp.]|uniref:2-hydroxy-3-oxopropionate reductase n=1 Tax=Lichenicola sp. TaxID=2804529 RepID=UPI003AFF8A07
MGRPMAEHLIKAGHRVRLASRSGVPSGMGDGDVVKCASAAEAAMDAEVIITMVPDTPDVEAVLFGPAGVMETAKPGSIVVDMSSISPLASKQFAARLGERGIGCLDAPVSGGEVGAKAASLTIMVGGPAELFERVKPLFALMGRNINLVGEHGAGQTTKVANQIIVALTIEAVSEALVFASRAGADPARVREALLGGFANSRVLEVHGERMIKRNFTPGFRVELHQKDLNLALENARLLGVSLPATALARSLFSACESHGGGRDDHSSMVRAIELLANHEIGRPIVDNTNT